MAIFQFTAQNQSSPEFRAQGDLDAKPGARFKIIHSDLKGATIQVQQKCSDGNWWTVHQISGTSILSTVIDSPHGGLMRLHCPTGGFGTGAFSIVYGE